MARKTFDELVDEINEESSQTTTETVETPAETTEETQQTETETETGEQTTPSTSEDAPADPAPAETDKPADPAPGPDPHEEVIDEIDKTNAIVRKRLEKQAKKYEAEKQAIRDEYESRIKALEERTAPKPKELTRDQFAHDEDFVAALTQQQIEKDRAEQARIKAEKDAEDAKKREAEEAEAEDIRQRQTRFLANVDSCFEGTEKDTFLAHVKHANSKGLGTLLDASPMASDYLLSSPKGPLVFNKILNDAETFKRVFPAQGISPMEQFAELRDIQREIEAERAEKARQELPPAIQEKVKPTPKLGKPGVQGQGGTAGDPMLDPKSRRDYVRNLLYGHK